MALVPKPRDIRSLHHIYTYLHAVIKMSAGCFIHFFTFSPPANVGKGQLSCFQIENAPPVSTRGWRGCPRKQHKQEGAARLPSELAVRIVFRPLAQNETLCAWPTVIVNRCWGHIVGWTFSSFIVWSSVVAVYNIKPTFSLNSHFPFLLFLEFCLSPNTHSCEF